MPAFGLSKWYLDCVSMQGDVFIGYSARLRWRPLSISYQSALIHLADGETKTWTSLRGRTPPAPGPDRIEWNAPALGVRGSWIGAMQPVTERLFACAEGEIVWSCHLPRADAEVTTPAGLQVAGAGYAEHLSMSIPPWRIPISELRWGRFLGQREALVWIDWRGERRQTVVVRNGVRVMAPRIDDQRIELSDGTRLCLDQGCILRNGALGATALSAIPGIHRFAPARMLAAQECKWRSRATLSSPGGPEEHGWAIHEVIRWP